MIKDKKLGLVMTENKEETVWYNVVENLKQEIKLLKMRRKRAKEDLKISDRKIAQKFREGAKLAAKDIEGQITVTAQFLKTARYKLKNAC